MSAATNRRTAGYGILKLLHKAAEPTTPNYDVTSAEELVLQLYFDDGSDKEPRYYRIQAINRVVERVARGQRRLLILEFLSFRT